MHALPLIPNQQARRIFLARHGLAEAVSGPAQGAPLRALIARLGFVQIDSIATIERAHHMILFARRQNYRPQHLTPLLERDRHLWEHWTHDAAILPIEVYPHWRHRFRHNRDTLVQRWTGWQAPGFETQFEQVLQHIRVHGATAAAELGEAGARPKSGWWDWHPTKAALEFLWQSGALAITRRDSFRKIYDLSERVIPAAHLAPDPDYATSLDWACRAALDRLGFGTASEIAAFWKLFPLDAVKSWCAKALADGILCQALIEAHPSQPAAARLVYLWPATLTESAAEPPRHIRLLSPFDPVLRDRKRAAFLFGFNYRIEIYTPEAKRQFGYYVFPLLEGDQLIGRLDAKAQRDTGHLILRAVWPEPGIRLGRMRQSRLDKALQRVAAFAGCSQLTYLDGWLREAQPQL